MTATGTEELIGKEGLSWVELHLQRLLDMPDPVEVAAILPDVVQRHDVALVGDGLRDEGLMPRAVLQLAVEDT